MNPELQERLQWECAACGKGYPDNDQGKKMAETCCCCMECGSSRYMKYLGGHHNRCERCCLQSTLASAVRQLEGAQETLNRIEREAGGCGLQLVAVDDEETKGVKYMLMEAPAKKEAAHGKKKTPAHPKSARKAHRRD